MRLHLLILAMCVTVTIHACSSGCASSEVGKNTGIIASAALNPQQPEHVTYTMLPLSAVAPEHAGLAEKIIAIPATTGNKDVRTRVNYPDGTVFVDHESSRSAPIEVAMSGAMGLEAQKLAFQQWQQEYWAEFAERQIDRGVGLATAPRPRPQTDPEEAARREEDRMLMRMILLAFLNRAGVEVPVPATAGRTPASAPVGQP